MVEIEMARRLADDLAYNCRDGDAGLVRALCDEVERLRAEHTALIEDRARFPDKPDFVGRMIGAHVENLKAAREQSINYAIEAMNRTARALRQRDEAFRAGFRAARPNARHEAVENAVAAFNGGTR